MYYLIKMGYFAVNIKDKKMQKVNILSSTQVVSMNDEWFELADPGHFWMQWRFRALVNKLKSVWKPEMKVLEIGCGNGALMFQFEQYFNVPVDGCDLNLFALQNAIHVDGNLYLYDILERNHQLEQKYDVVLMADVLEHIDNDARFLEAAKFHLRDGGIIVVGVPAHQRLFSVYDQNVGHKRRYSHQQLENSLRLAGFDVVESNFWGFSLLPVLIARNLLLKLMPTRKIISTGFKPPHFLFNKIMLGLMKLETAIFKKPFIGISLIATGRK
jgi:2-polyprenyl-3-methyl-5-hydroxy-6-metoxy-1,4-benzoquinol methylase